MMTMTTATVDNEDLGLSLSLNLATTTSTVAPPLQPLSAFQFNLLSAPHHHAFSPLRNSSFTDSLPLPCTTDRNSEARPPSSPFGGIDVNRIPVSLDDEESPSSSPNSTISTVSGKRCERENDHDTHRHPYNGANLHNDNAVCCEDNDADRTSSRGGGSDEDDGDTSRKKLRLSKDQSAILEDTFKEHNTLNPKQKLALAKRLGLRPRQVEVWFQNRRARTKLKQTEVDCEFLKRCCEQLTEENRRLQKEVQELRALKLSPQFYMQMTPPTTLTMCPSCERVGVPAAPSQPSAAAKPLDSRPGGIPVAPPAAHRPVATVNPWVAAPVVRRV